MRMGRNNTHAKTVGAAFRGGDGALVNVTAVSVFTAFAQDRDGWILDTPIFRFAVICFHAHMFRINAAEINPRG